MKLILKVIFILAFSLMGFQSFAYVDDYVSVFKPVKKSKNVLELQSNIKKDIFKIRALINFQEKKIIGFMKNEKNHETDRVPADI